MRICYPCSMYELTKDALREIEQIHSSWVEYEVAGDSHSLMALCADDIELWPPDARPLRGRAAVSAQMAHEKTKIHSIEITDRRIRGSNEIAYLTASYRTTFSSADDSICRQALGSHLWILRKRAGVWVVTLVSWSVWAVPTLPRQSSPLSLLANLITYFDLSAIGSRHLPVLFGWISRGVEEHMVYKG